MKRSVLFAAAFLLAIPAAIHDAAGTGAWLPAPLRENADLIDRYWTWLLDETGAPANLPKPTISVGSLPRTARMVVLFPSRSTPHHDLRIIVSKRSMNRAAGGEELVVVGELAHELAHYVLLLAENGWDIERPIMKNEVHHHCDETFKHLNRGVGRFIWQTYHSSDAVREINHMVETSCRRDGFRLRAAARKQP